MTAFIFLVIFCDLPFRGPILVMQPETAFAKCRFLGPTFLPFDGIFFRSTAKRPFLPSNGKKCRQHPKS